MTVKACTVKTIIGEESVRNNPKIVSFLPRCKEGDVITWAYNVNQRLGEFDILADNTEDLINSINFVHKTLLAYDENGDDAIFARFDTNRL